MKIFINYRRQDSIDITGRIYDRLVAKFGKKSVFKDVDSIPLGVDFREYLDAQVVQCDVFLSVIGQDWLILKDDDDKRRIDNPDDFVRIEIESAMQRKLPIIPLFVRGMTTLSASELPPTIHRLSTMNGMQIRSDPDFHKDVDRLIVGIQKFGKRREKERMLSFPNWLMVIFQVFMFFCAGILVYMTGLMPDFLISLFLGTAILVVYYYLIRNTLNLDFARGIRSVKSGKFKDAASSFEKSASFFAKYPFLDTWRFIILLSSSQYGYREMALTNLGFVYAKLGDHILSKKNYEMCIELNPKNKSALAALSLINLSVAGPNELDS